MRRKPGSLLPLEVAIIRTASQRPETELYGYMIAKLIQYRDGGLFVGYGALYKALSRLERAGLLSSHWEDVETSGRPRRRLYSLTPDGANVARLHEDIRASVRPTVLRGEPRTA